MNASIDLLVYGTIIGVLILSVVLSIWLYRKRKAAFRAYAEENGFSFDDDPDELIFQLEDFKLFSTGRSRFIDFVLKKQQGPYGIQLMHYQYNQGSGKGSSTIRYVVCVIDVKDGKLPHFHLRREIPLFDRLGNILGGQDINFEEDEQFSSRFVLQGQDEAETRKLFHAGTRQAFLEVADSNICAEGRGSMLVCHFGKALNPKEAEHLVEQSVKLATRLR